MYPEAALLPWGLVAMGYKRPRDLACSQSLARVSSVLPSKGMENCVSPFDIQ